MLVYQRVYGEYLPINKINSGLIFPLIMIMSIMILMSYDYHLVMTNIAMENQNHKWRFLAGKIIYEWAMASMAMLNNQRVMD